MNIENPVNPGYEETQERKIPVSIKMTRQTQTLFKDYVASSGMTQEEAIKQLIEKAEIADERPKTALYEALTAEIEPHLAAILNVLKTAYGATETAVLAEQQKAEAAISKVTAEKDSLLETVNTMKAQQQKQNEEVEDFRKRVLASEDFVKRAKEEQQKAEEREAAAKSSLAENQELTKSLRTSLESSQERVKHLELETEKVPELQKQLDLARSEIQKEKDHNADLEKQAAITAVKMDSLNEKLAKGELDLKQKADDLAAYKRMYEEVFTQLTDTRRELSKAQSEITELTKKLKAAE